MLFNCLTCLTIMTRQQRRTWWMLMNYAKKKPDEIRGLPLSSPRSTWWNQPFAIQCKHLARSVVTWNESCHQHFFYPYLYIYHITYYVYTVIHILIYMLHITCMQSHAEQYPSATPVGTKRAHPVEHISETSRIGAKHGRCFFENHEFPNPNNSQQQIFESFFTSNLSA